MRFARDGTGWCFGWNLYGELGNGTNVDALTPSQVVNLSGGASIAVGESHSCAARLDGSAACWGLNDYGQLGNGTTNNSNVAVAVTGL